MSTFNSLEVVKFIYQRYNKFTERHLYSCMLNCYGNVFEFLFDKVEMTEKGKEEALISLKGRLPYLKKNRAPRGKENLFDEYYDKMYHKLRPGLCSFVLKSNRFCKRKCKDNFCHSHK